MPRAGDVEEPRPLAGWHAVLADADLVSIEAIGSRLVEAIVADVEAEGGALWVDRGGRFERLVKRGAIEAAPALVPGARATAALFAAASARSASVPGPEGSEIAAPLVAAGRVFGVLGVVLPRPVDVSAVARFEFLARIAAGPLQRARLAGRLEEMSEARKAALAREQRLRREMEDFATWVAHDVREPLRSLSTLASLLEREALDPEARSMLGRIVDVAEHVRRRVARLQAMSDVAREFEIRPVDAEGLAAEAVRGARARARKSTEIEVVHGAGVIAASPRALVVALVEILTNALNHADPDAPFVRFESRAEPASVAFTVVDNGPGLPPDPPRPLDAVFSRGPAEISSAGMGLAIARKVAELHGGDLAIGRAGTFTEVRLTVPRVAAPGAQGAPRRARGPLAGPSP